MDLSYCYITAGMVCAFMCFIMGAAEVNDKYDKWTGEITREFLVYFIIGPICSIILALVGILMGA